MTYSAFIYTNQRAKEKQLAYKSKEFKFGESKTKQIATNFAKI